MESLLLVGRELARARSELSGLLPPSEAHALDLFYSRAVGSAEDLRDHVLRAGERLSALLECGLYCCLEGCKTLASEAPRA